MLVQSSHGLLHGRHGGGQQSGNANDGDLGIVGSFQELLNGDIDAQVDDLVAGGLDHHDNQVLADVVQVTGNGAHGHLANLGSVVASQVGLQNLNALLHGLGSNQHLGNEDLVSLELVADDCHGVNHALVQNVDRSVALVQCLLNQTGYQFRLTDFYGMSQFFNFRHFSFPL